MQIISLEDIRTQYSADSRKGDKTIVKKLNRHIGKKVVIVFKDPIAAKRNIRRHHCTIEGLGHMCVLFTPCIRIPRKKYNDLLMPSAFFERIKHIEIV